MPKDENIDLFSLVHDVISRVDALTGATLLAIHNGKEAGQEIPHVHVHLVPRNSSDSAGPIHSLFSGQCKISESEMETTYKLLK